MFAGKNPDPLPILQNAHELVHSCSFVSIRGSSSLTIARYSPNAPCEGLSPTLA